MSAREEVQTQVVDALREMGLDEVYGVTDGTMKDSKGKSYRFATFCKARITDGMVKIYSPTFILVSWQTANRTMPSRGSEVFRSVDSAMTFVRESFA